LNCLGIEKELIRNTKSSDRICQWVIVLNFGPIHFELLRRKGRRSHSQTTKEELAMYELSLGVSQPVEVVPTLMHLMSDASVTILGNLVERRLIPRA